LRRSGEATQFREQSSGECCFERRCGDMDLVLALCVGREGKCRVLVATDVAARGLDIGGVEHVINMDLPNAKDDFDSYRLHIAYEFALPAPK
jgi:hypothetical protein